MTTTNRHHVSRATIAKMAARAKKWGQCAYLVEMDHEDGRKQFIVPGDYLDTDEFTAFEGEAIAVHGWLSGQSNSPDGFEYL